MIILMFVLLLEQVAFIFGSSDCDIATGSKLLGKDIIIAWLGKKDIPNSF